MRPLGALTTVSGLAAQHAAAGRRHVCFERVVVGGYYDMFNAEHHAGKEPWLQLYRQRVLAHHALAPPPPSLGFAPPPTAHSFIIVNKQGRRGTYNFDEVVAYLRAACKGLATGWRRPCSRCIPHDEREEQLRIVSTATIALSPPGGVSMILPFLPEGAHAILINYMVGEGADTSRLRAEARVQSVAHHGSCALEALRRPHAFLPSVGRGRLRARSEWQTQTCINRQRFSSCCEGGKAGVPVRVALDKMARPE